MLTSRDTQRNTLDMNSSGNAVSENTSYKTENDPQGTFVQAQSPVTSL